MISVVRLGSVSYSDGLRLQQKLVDLRKRGQIPDLLLLLEHTPVITLGRNARAANILAPAEHLAARGVEVFECDRGGDVTFHGPGQLVGYPILDLRGFERSSEFSVLSSQKGSSQLQVPSSKQPSMGSLPVDRKTLGAVDYVRRLEEALIRTCGDFGIPTKRVAGLTGVWTEGEGRSESRDPSTTSEGSPRESPNSAQDDIGSLGIGASEGEAKIAAIGVHISRSITSHGFALNVNTDLSYFNLIVPCGITAKPVTSMQKELGRGVEIDAVAHSLARNFGIAFARQILWLDTIDALLGQSVGVPMKPPAEIKNLHGGDDPFFA